MHCYIDGSDGSAVVLEQSNTTLDYNSTTDLFTIGCYFAEGEIKLLIALPIIGEITTFQYI